MHNKRQSGPCGIPKKTQTAGGGARTHLFLATMRQSDSANGICFALFPGSPPTPIPFQESQGLPRTKGREERKAEGISEALPEMQWEEAMEKKPAGTRRWSPRTSVLMAEGTEGTVVASLHPIGREGWKEGEQRQTARQKDPSSSSTSTIS